MEFWSFKVALHLDQLSSFITRAMSLSPSLLAIQDDEMDEDDRASLASSLQSQFGTPLFGLSPSEEVSSVLWKSSSVPLGNHSSLNCSPPSRLPFRLCYSEWLPALLTTLWSRALTSKTVLIWRWRALQRCEQSSWFASFDTNCS